MLRFFAIGHIFKKGKFRKPGKDRVFPEFVLTDEFFDVIRLFLCQSGDCTVTNPRFRRSARNHPMLAANAEFAQPVPLTC